MISVAHLGLVFLVIFVWGINFLFVKLALIEIPPLLLCTLRFLLASVPVIFFIKKPAIPFRIIALYGLLMFALQFSLLFIGMYVGMTAGMASLIMQTQVFFSMFFAAIFLKEQTNAWQITGAIISFLGVGLVALHCDKNLSFLGIILILAAASTWGLGNLITKKNHNINMIALVVWGSFFACLPMLILSVIVDGPRVILYKLEHLSFQGSFSLAYIVCMSTWVGYGVWNWLLSRYPVGTIVPFTFLVPVVGVLSSVIILHEPLQLWKLESGLLIVSGLFINLFGKRLEFLMRRNLFLAKKL